MAAVSGARFIRRRARLIRKMFPTAIIVIVSRRPIARAQAAGRREALTAWFPYRRLRAFNLLRIHPQAGIIYELESDIVRNNTVDWSDLNIIAQQWLIAGCDATNQWCAGADLNGSSGVDLD